MKIERGNGEAFTYVYAGQRWYSSLLMLILMMLF